MNNNEILDKLYLNPILEINEHRKKLIPIRQKEVKRFASVEKALLSSKSVPDIFKGMNGKKKIFRKILENMLIYLL